MASIPPTNLFIDGAWVDASTGETFDAFDPRTGAVIAQVHQAGPFYGALILPSPHFHGGSFLK